MQWKRRPLSCEYALKAEPNRHSFIFSFLIDGFIRPLPPDEHLSKKKTQICHFLPAAEIKPRLSSASDTHISQPAQGVGRWGEAQRQIDGIGGGRVHYSEDMCSFRPAVTHQVGFPPVPFFVFIFRTCARTNVHSREFPPTCPGSRGPVCLVSSFLPDAQTGLLDGCDADLVTKKFLFKSKKCRSPQSAVCKQTTSQHRFGVKALCCFTAITGCT